MMLLIDSDYLQSIKFHPLPYMQITPPDVAPESYKRGWNDVVDVVLNDADPVVRCGECVHRDPEDHKCDCGELERAGCVFPVDDDYYCKYGQRREGGGIGI